MKIPKSAIRITLGVIIGILIIVVVSIIQIQQQKENKGGRMTATPDSVLQPVVSVFSNITGNPKLQRINDNLERDKHITERHKKEIAKEPELDREKKALDAFMQTAGDLDFLMSIERHSGEYRSVCKEYEKTKFRIKASKSGKTLTVTLPNKISAPMDSRLTMSEVSNTIQSIRNLKVTIAQYAAAAKKRRIYLSNKDKIKENTERLAFILNQSGIEHQVNVDSFGLNKNDQGELRILVINGFLCYKPGNTWNRAEKCLKELGFTPEKKEDSNLDIALLKNNDKKLSHYWGNTKNLDLKLLKNKCSLFSRYNEYQGVYAKIFLPCGTYCLPCNRLTSAVNKKLQCETVFVDLRPQSWVRWTLCYPVNDEWKIRSLVERSAKAGVEQPYLTTCYGIANLQWRHTAIEQRLSSQISGNVSVNGNVAEKVNPSVGELFLGQKNGQTIQKTAPRTTRRGTKSRLRQR